MVRDNVNLETRKFYQIRISIERFLAFIAVLYFFFYEYVQTLVSYSGACILGIFIIIVASLVILKYKFKGLLYSIPLLAFFLLTIIRNQVVENQSFLLSFVNTMAFFAVLFALCVNYNWIDTYLSLIKVLGTISVFTTIVFFFLPNAGQLQYSFWGMYPNGTENGLYAYRAGIFSNYSANGIYVAIAFIYYVSKAIFFVKNRKKVPKMILLWIILSSIALLLTTKRAHLLFSVLALVIIYFILGGGKMSNRIIKFLIAVGAALVLLYIGTYFIPSLGDTFGRFSLDDSGDISTGRFLFWEYAISSFLEYPLFGIGWFGFRFINFNITYTAGYYDAHCVYLQLLCETGIVGSVIILFAIFSTLIRGIRFFKAYSTSIYDKYSCALMFAISIQLFCILYSITGNVLYDRTLFIYLISVALQTVIVRSSNSLRGGER